MRRLLYTINVTLDGCVDHRAVDATEELHAHAASVLAGADALLFGRVTYQMMEGAWRAPHSDAMPAETQQFARAIDAAEKFVVSSTLASVDWNAQLVTGDLADAVRRIKDGPGDYVYVCGVQLPTALADLGLIDEYEFVVHPTVAGHGRRLFDGLSHPLDLTLTGAEEWRSGAVARRYVPRATA